VLHSQNVHAIKKVSVHLGHNDVCVLPNKWEIQVAEADIRASGIRWIRGRDHVVEIAGRA
jgi:hypothetical protein